MLTVADNLNHMKNVF